MRRVYFGVRFSSAFQSDLCSSLHGLQTRAPSDIKWTAEKDFHLTLLFFGAISDDRYEVLRQMSFDQKLLPAAFNLEFNDIGFFPSTDKPQVAWLGVKDESKALLSLHERLAKVFKSWIDKSNEENFNPHITIARSRHKLNHELFKKVKLTLKQEPIHEFFLFESLPGRTPRYQIRAIYPLRPK
ncbi:MAG: RNA 2',3'-cyclic phosphodiesterase [Deltaproteobacteria bacterium CG11_big_fil_rev_8_21_14_0_20_45_16]|nr:MAG: RNA 2',3'-cyclic phosphodiesterase [Deltaproteobacteria bacterium CG11_big_fil_rev_8_21_14_0_20_45_16]